MALVNSGMTLYADHDTQESWNGTDDLDTYGMSIQGSNSESWNVAKNSTETGTMSKSASMGTPKYFTAWMKSDLTNYYTSIKMRLNDGSNASEFTCADITNRDITGEFHPSVLQISEGSNASYVPNNHTQFICEINNSSSGNIRSVINNWIDTMHYGDGRIIAGSTVSDKVFYESHILDSDTNDEYDGCSELFKSGLAYYTDVTLNATLGNSFGETVTWAYQRNTDNNYTLTVLGTSEFRASNYLVGDTLVTLNLDTSGATSWGMSGGSLVAEGTTVFKAGQDVKGVVFTNRTSFTHNGCNFENNTLNYCGAMSAVSGGTATGNTFNESIGVSVICDDVSAGHGNTFISGGANHAIELTSVGGGTMSWACTTIGYEAGVTGTPVTPTNTGNETIHITATTGEVTINVADGYIVPSIKSDGAIVNVVAGQITMTMSGHPVGAKVLIYDLDNADEQNLGTELFRNNNASSSEQYSYSGGKAGDDVQVKVLMPNYKVLTKEVVLSATDSTFDTKLETETN